MKKIIDKIRNSSRKTIITWSLIIVFLIMLMGVTISCYINPNEIVEKILYIIFISFIGLIDVVMILLLLSLLIIKILIWLSEVFNNIIHKVKTTSIKEVIIFTIKTLFALSFLGLGVSCYINPNEVVMKILLLLISNYFGLLALAILCRVFRKSDK